MNIDNEVKNKIINHIEANKKQLINILKKAISFDSSSIEQGVYGKEKDIQLWLNEVMEEMGLETHLFEPDNKKIKEYNDFNSGHNYKDRPNLIGIHKGVSRGKSLILNGHVDTVDVGDVKNWDYDPWQGIIKDNYMYGRGTTDMKSGTISMIMALKILKELKIEIKGDVIIQSVVDEEGGGNGTLTCVAEGYSADAAIVTEPTNLEIQPIGRGVLLLKVEVKGKSSHAAYKWSGVNAIEKSMKIANGLSNLEHKWLANKTHPLLPSPTINLGYISGGTEAPIVPDYCEMKFDIKYLPKEVKQNKEIYMNGERTKGIVEDEIKRICESDEWLKENKPKLKWYLHVMPHDLNKDHEFVETIESVSEDLFGVSKISGLRSGSDARHLLNSGNIPTVVFGPGNMEDAHTINEKINLDSYIKSIKVLALIILEWTSKEK